MNIKKKCKNVNIQVYSQRLISILSSWQVDGPVAPPYQGSRPVKIGLLPMPGTQKEQVPN